LEKSIILRRAFQYLFTYDTFNSLIAVTKGIYKEFIKEVTIITKGIYKKFDCSAIK
jgi:hypothetical protein